MCCKFPSAGPAPNDDNLKQTMHSAPKADLSKDHMNWAHLCSLNEWIINFVLFFFKLVLVRCVMTRPGLSSDPPGGAGLAEVRHCGGG